MGNTKKTALFILCNGATNLGRDDIKRKSQLFQYNNKVSCDLIIYLISFKDTDDKRQSVLLRRILQQILLYICQLSHKDPGSNYNLSSFLELWGIFEFAKYFQKL